MKFTEYVYNLAQPSWEASKQHPFIQELVVGRLPLEVFRFYLIQDAYYLKHFVKAHELVIEQTDNEWIIKSQRFCKEGLVDSELVIREQFFKELAITEDIQQQTPIAPTAYHYTSHIYRQFTVGTLATALAALLPCYWLYYEIGTTFAQKQSPVAMYQQFLDTYDSADFKAVLDELIALVDEVAQQVSETERKQMAEAFLMSSHYELNFWQMAYTQETW